VIRSFSFLDGFFTREALSFGKSLGYMNMVEKKNIVAKVTYEESENIQKEYCDEWKNNVLRSEMTTKSKLFLNHKFK
jgi:hypothetical protein